MKLTFLGAAGTVTGSKYLMEFPDKKILVDCGMFQGLKELRLLNWEEPTFDPSSIDAVLLTHGHLDHMGYLPRLVTKGFKGKIFATSPTLKISEIILKDSAIIQEEEADRANREGYSKHTPAKPIYNLKDVEKTLKLFSPVPEGEWINIGKQKAIFQYNGHIIGSTFIQIEAEGKTFVFSGDLGREKDMLLFPPKRPQKADVLFIESTYGGRIHPDEESIMSELSKIINETIDRRGSVFIPSFAVERTQLLMFILWRLLKSNKIPKVPMIMDSPMSADVLELFRETKGWHKLTDQECIQICSHFKIVGDYTESMNLQKKKKPKIVIAGSGMMTGGRILGYMEHCAKHKRDTLLFVGYQAEGTRGRRLVEGEREIKMYGKIISFKMQIKQIEGLSAHGDQNDLLFWIKDLPKPPAHIFIVHGEMEQAEALKQKLKETKNWSAEIPKLNQTVEL